MKTFRRESDKSKFMQKLLKGDERLNCTYTKNAAWLFEKKALTWILKEQDVEDGFNILAKEQQRLKQRQMGKHWGDIVF